MGSPIHEVCRRREAGDPPAGRTIVVTGAADPGPARHPALYLLRVVRALSGARRRGPGRWPAGAAPRLEQASGYGRAGRGWAGPQRARAVAAGGCGLIRRPAAVLCLSILGLPLAEGTRPDPQSRLYPDEGGRP